MYKPDSEQKKEIIREILLKYSGSVQGYEALQKELWASNLAQLQRIQVAYQVDTSDVQRRIAEIQDESIWTSFFFKHPEIRDIAANRKMLFDHALSLSDDGVVKFEHLIEAAQLPGLARQKVKQLPTASNLKQDEETLQKYCRVSRLEPSTAALSLLRQQFGAGFNHEQIDQAIHSGLINLGPASEENILQWTAEDQKARQDWLANEASPAELRQAAQNEFEQNRAQFQRKEQERQIKIREQAEAGQHPALPETNQSGVKLDAVFFKNLADTNISLFKQYCAKYGFAAITARLNGVR